MNTYQFAVRGVTYEGRQDKIAKIRGNEPVRALPEPTNQFDPNAISILVACQGVIMHVGYMPKEQAQIFAPRMAGEGMDGRIIRVTGGVKKYDGSYASFGLIVEFDLPDADEENA